MGEKIKKILLVNVPVDKCNFKCSYCYIGQLKAWNKYNEDLGYLKEYDLFRKAFSKDRFGGPCFINLCAKGETLIYPEIVKAIRIILEEGHYLEVVTNGSLTKRFEEIALFPKDLLNHLEFKFSFHYMELIRMGLIENFFNNVNMMKNAGASFTIEMTPVDEEEEYIEDIKKTCLEHVGALCHTTIARDDRKESIPVLSEHSFDEYCNVWSSFESPMFEFKKKIFQEHRNEFCYAGAWSLYINIITGQLSKCYGEPVKGNFYDLNNDLSYEPIGKCRLAHCYNGHALMTLGLLPDIETPYYSSIRNRICYNGTEWLSKDVRDFFETRLKDSNNRYSKSAENKIVFKRKMSRLFSNPIRLSRQIINILFRKKK